MITNILLAYWPELAILFATLVAMIPSFKAHLIPEDELVMKGLLSHSSDWWRRRMHYSSGIPIINHTLTLSSHLLNEKGKKLKRMQIIYGLAYLPFLIVYLYFLLSSLL